MAQPLEPNIQIIGEHENDNDSMSDPRRQSYGTVSSVDFPASGPDVADIQGNHYEDENIEGQPLLYIKENVEVPGSSWYASVFLVVNAALGAGLLNFPKAFDEAGGIAVSMIVQGVLMAFIVIALLILAFCSNLHQSATYQDMLFSMCGRSAQNLCSLAIALYCYGTCITFLIIIGDQWDRLFYSITEDKLFCYKFYMSRKFSIIVTSFIFILPICFPKRIDFLKYASAGGVVAVMYVVFLVVGKYAANIDEVKKNVHVKTKPDSLFDVFAVVPVICFGYQCHVSVIPIYSCLKKRSVKEFSKTVFVSMAVCIISYSLTAIFGYISFGSKVDDDILKSYNPDGWVLAGIIMIALKTYTTYPILLFCGRAAFDSLWYFFCIIPPHKIRQGEKVRRYVVTIIWFLTTVVIAVFIPNISIVINILGGLAAVFIFVFPGLCLLQVGLSNEHVQTKWKRNLIIIFSTCYMAIGSFIFGVVFVQSIMNGSGNNGKVNDCGIPT